MNERFFFFIFPSFFPPKNGPWKVVAQVPAPSCEVTVDGCEEGIEYEARSCAEAELGSSGGCLDLRFGYPLVN